MRKILILIALGFLFSSCYNDGYKKFKNEKVLYDSILHYYNFSKNNNIPLDQRRNALNKSSLLLKKTSGDSLLSRILYQKNLLHFLAKEYDSILLYNGLFNDFEENTDHPYIAEQYYLMGYYYGEIEKISDSAFKYYSSSKNYFKKSLDSNNKVGVTLFNMGTIQKDQNDYFGSKETLTEALKYLNPKKNQKYIASCYSALATAHRKLLNYKDAIEYYKKAIAISPDQKDRLIYQNNLAASYIDQKEFEKAILLLKNLSQHSLLIQDTEQYPRVLDNLTYAQWLSHQEVTENDFLRPLKLRKANKDFRGQLASYTHLGEFYTKKQPKRALAFLDTVIQLSKKTKIPVGEQDALRFMMTLEPNNVVIRNRFIYLQDSIDDQEKQVSTQFAKLKYDDQQREADLLRLEKEKTEKELEVTQQRTQKIIYLGGFLGTIIVLSLSVFSFWQRTRRLKQENNIARLEAVYETEAKLSHTLHDDYGGKLNLAMAQVQNDAEKIGILDTLEALYEQSRDFSRTINEVETGVQFWKELRTMLRTRTPSTAQLLLIGHEKIDWLTMPPISKRVVFKVLQELMINMGKHSKASSVSFQFEKTKKALKIIYVDDGVGATKEELRFKNGLRNTEKRIRALGGTVTFDTEKGKGFRAEIHIPL